MNTLEKGMMLGYFYKGAFHPKYKITRQMNIPGEGNSRLYIATDVASNTRVVAKLPKGDPSEEDDQSTLNIENAMIRSRERQILVEHQFLKTNKHPNIAACKDLARTKDGCPALILEDLSDSLSLEELLKYSRRFQTPVGERADRRFREFANLTYGTAWHSIGTDDSDPQEIHEKPDALGLTSHIYGSIAQLVDVGHYLTSIGKSHNDIKPANILIHVDRGLQLIDFGMMTEGSQFPLFGNRKYGPPDRFWTAESIKSRIYCRSLQDGTPSPHTYSFATDHWNIFIIGIEALTGEHPIGEDKDEIIKRLQEIKNPEQARKHMLALHRNISEKNAQFLGYNSSYGDPGQLSKKILESYQRYSLGPRLAQASHAYRQMKTK